MEFYIRPPGGTVALYNIERCVAQRFDILKLLNYNKSTDDVAFDCLIEGTALDKIGHHMLRLMSLSCVEFREFFIEGETHFFVKRISTVTENGILIAIQKLKRHISDGSKFYVKVHKMLDVFSFIETALSQMPNSALVHAFSSDHSDECTEFTVKISFLACLQLVRKRIVELSDGLAAVPCGSWRQHLFPALFQTHLIAACSVAAERGCLQMVIADERLNRIVQRLRKWFETHGSGLKANIIKADDVDVCFHLFPPCQVHLYKTLRERHRLSHEPRRVLSLFLKDIGMPIEQAVVFWKREYSRKANSACSCTHSWQKDTRKLVYSIRHMYGLEGSRINYKAHSCKTIQNQTLPPLSEGGCPFVHFDRDRLIQCLSPRVVSDHKVLEEILSLARVFPAKACLKHLAGAHTDTTGSFSTLTSPVQYYACAYTASKFND